MLANPEVHVSTAVGTAPGGCLKVSGTVELEAGLGGGCEIRRAPDQPGDVFRDLVEHLTTGHPGRHALLVRGVGVEPGVPAFRQITVLHLVQLIRQFGVGLLVVLEQGEPVIPGLLAPLAQKLLEAVLHTIGHEEGFFGWPVVELLGELDLLDTQCLAVGGAGVLLVGRAPADVTVDDDQGRAIIGVLEDLEGSIEQVEVIGVTHPSDVPAVPDETGRDVVGVGQLGVTLDGDVVVVVDPAEVREFQVGSQ